MICRVIAYRDVDGEQDEERAVKRERRKRAVKEDPEYGVPLKMMEPEARDRGGNLSTEVGGVGAKSDRRRLVA